MGPLQVRRGGDRPPSRVGPIHLLAAAAILGLLVMPVAFADVGDPGATKSAKVTKQIKKLKRRVAALEAKPDQVGQIPASLPPTGPAGGDLTGTFPNPQIGTVQGSDVNSSSFVTLDPPPTPDDPATTLPLFQSGPIVFAAACDYVGDTTDSLLASVRASAPSEANIKLFRDGATFTAISPNALAPVLATDAPAEPSLKQVEQTMVLLTPSGYSFQGIGMAAVDIAGLDTCSVRASGFGTPG